MPFDFDSLPEVRGKLIKNTALAPYTWFRVGGPADITLIDPELEWTIDSRDFITTGRNCPFDGWSVSGRAIATLVGGKVRWALPGPRIEQVVSAGH